MLSETELFAVIVLLAVLASSQNGKPITATGTTKPDFIRDMLSDARTILPTRWQPAPTGATDLRLHRVCTYVNINDGMTFSAAKLEAEAK